MSPASTPNRVKATPGGARRWIYVHADQLSDQIGPLAELAPSEAGIVMVESRAWFGRRPYHRMRLAIIIANMRQFAAEQEARGVAVDYREGPESLHDQLAAAVAERGPLVMMQAAEFEVRRELGGLIEGGGLQVVPHEGWLTTREDFQASTGAKGRFRMDEFYRYVRRETGILMDLDGKPVGGRFSFDGDNRKPWKGNPEAPDPPLFEPNQISLEAYRHIDTVYTEHPGHLDPTLLPTTAEDATRLWRWALDSCMEHFGEYEDAMSTISRGVFHTRVSPLINLHRLLPRDVVRDVENLDIPLNSKEGFIRQVIGWREYVRHVHEATDGFRSVSEGIPPARPGDGGYAQWAGKPWIRPSGDAPTDGGANPNFLGADLPLPAAWWGRSSGLACLDHVVESVWAEGWSHHITRLMVLSNIATLLDVDPRDLADWFWVAYVDAWDWVVEPNVLGMGTFSTGEVMTTKPYVAGASYISKMSNYCRDCRFSPTGDCPLRRLYWAFLARHEQLLDGNQRMWTVLNSMRRRSAEERELDARLFHRVRELLARGEVVDPSNLSG